MIKKLSIFLLLIFSIFGSTLFADELILSPKLQTAVGETENDVYVSNRVITTEPRQMSEFDILLASSDPEYIVRSGDIISVSYIDRAGSTPVFLSLRVPYDGKIRIPTIATIETEGRKFLDVKAEIEDVLLRYNKYSEPVVNLESLGVFNVVVKGEVEIATTLVVNGLYRLSDVLYLAKDSASVRNVMVLGKDGSCTSYDLYEALKNGDQGQNPRLNPMDQIVFSPAERIVKVEGGVKNPGLYELKKDENLQAVLTKYSGGLLSKADKVLVSHVDEDNYRSSKEYPIAEEVVLFDGDSVKVLEASQVNRTVSVVGALSGYENSASNIILGNKYSKYYYAFADGETVSDLMYSIKDLLLDSSDLKNATLTRNGEVVKIDLESVLYSGKVSDSTLLLQPGDVIEIPFTQMVVAVNGAVSKPGVYGYIPGKSADYYINIAGGLTAAAGKNGEISIKDKDGNTLDKNATITPESVINVEISSFDNNTQNTAVVLGLVTSVLGIVATTLSIVLPQIYN